jgi:hypothetical protein
VFRLAEVRWRGSAPSVGNWFERINDRKSMRLTMPE